LLLVCAPPSPARCQPERTATLLENGAYCGALVNRIREAKRRIICAFYLFKVGGKGRNLPAAISAELVKARQRGVEVTVILDQGRTSQLENRVAAGMLSQNGVRVIYASRRRVTHVKAVSIDDRFAMIGSHNLTQSALLHNNELSVLLDSPELAVQVRRYLEGIR
jgi:phosphatidylserine/phosphatidylglycerophosphate/cardiolipin synthase-like enzyme